MAVFVNCGYFLRADILTNAYYQIRTRNHGEGNGNPLQHSCLGNPMDRGAWWVTVHGDAKESDTEA